jgi:hypothetical protein
MGENLKNNFFDNWDSEEIRMLGKYISFFGKNQIIYISNENFI